jgi:hypothetical protein
MSLMGARHTRITTSSCRRSASSNAGSSVSSRSTYLEPAAGDPPSVLSRRDSVGSADPAETAVSTCGKVVEVNILFERKT